MTIDDLKRRIDTYEYEFLRDDKRFGNNLILLGPGGTYAYGLEDEDSDLNVIGITLNSKREVLTGKSFDRFYDESTDAVIFSFSKVISLLLKGNPATLDMLGLKNEHYLYLSPIANELLFSKKMFISKKTVRAYERFIRKALYSIMQKADGENFKRDMERLVLENVNDIKQDLTNRYTKMPIDSIYLYLGNSLRDINDIDIYMDMNLAHYPLRDYINLADDLRDTAEAFNKPGRRKGDAITLENISKHCMHLVRLYLTLFDILEQHDIITCREKDRDMLLDIKHGRFIGSDGKPNRGFFRLIDDYDKRLAVLKQRTTLPEEPDYEMIDLFVMSVNERIIRGEI